MSGTVLAGMLLFGFVACSGVVARAPERDRGPGELGDRALERTLVAGTLLAATIEGARSRRRAALGELVTATVRADVTNALRRVVIPAGSSVGLRIVGWRWAAPSSRAGARITLEVLSVTARGVLYPVRATVELAAAHPPTRDGVMVAPGTPILFVLSEGFTADAPPPRAQP